jgi:peptide deformylase
MIHRILHIGEEPLREVSEEITKIDDEMRTLAADMFETMYKAHGCGLAAPQIGVNKRMVVIDTDNEHKFVMINPEITKATGKEICEEGCLSLPGLREKVQRAVKITARFTDLEGKQIEITTEGLLARAIQHELDHLEGVLFVDRISKARRMQIRHELKILEDGGTLETDDDEDEGENPVEGEANAEPVAG